MNAATINLSMKKTRSENGNSPTAVVGNGNGGDTPTLVLTVVESSKIQHLIVSLPINNKMEESKRNKLGSKRNKHQREINLPLTAF